MAYKRSSKRIAAESLVPKLLLASGTRGMTQPEIRMALRDRGVHGADNQVADLLSRMVEFGDAECVWTEEEGRVWRAKVALRKGK